MNNINCIHVVGNGTQLPHTIVGKIYRSSMPGLVYIDVPEYVQDKYMTVLALQLNKPVQLYSSNGGFLTNND